MQKNTLTGPLAEPTTAQNVKQVQIPQTILQDAGLLYFTNKELERQIAFLSEQLKLAYDKITELEKK